MSYPILKKYAESLGGHQVATITGPLSPLLLFVQWSQDPMIPLHLLNINKGRQSVCIVDEHYYHLLAEEKFRNYIEKKISKKELWDAYYEYANKSQSIYNEVIKTDLSTASDTELVSLLQKVVNAFELVAETVYIETLNYDMALKVVGVKNKHTLDVVWEQSIHPTFVSFDGRRLAHMIDLLKKNENVETVVRAAKYIFTDYFWTKNDADIVAALQDIKNHFVDKENELAAILANVASRKSVYDLWAATLSPEEVYIADYIQMIMFFRDIRKDPIAQVHASIIEITSELLQRAGIDPEYGRALNIYECVKGIDFLKANKEHIMKRADGNITVHYFGQAIQVELCDFDTAVEEVYALTSKASSGVADVIKGQIANKGKVTGTVRIVLDPHDDKGFQQGDVLVTSMTRPEFVPIMKKAGAVVTDEGGITCHAAIVSRELNIPCVIGTKNATRLLKDGDMVEVDANNGIVRIIK